MSHIAGLVLARGGSKGIQRKNIRNLAGLPLLAWVLQPMSDSGIFSSIWVSTDDPEIAKTALQWNAKIHYRNPATARDESSSLEAVCEFIQKHPEIHAIGLVQCTSPCLHPSYLETACKMIHSHKYDSVFSVTRVHQFRWKEVPLGSSTEPLNFNPKHRIRRQDWAGEMIESGHFYFATVSLIRQGLLQGGKCGYVEIPKKMCIEIDNEEDWSLAQHIVELYGYKRQSSLYDNNQFKRKKTS